MATILFMSEFTEGLPLANAISANGHVCKIFTKSEAPSGIENRINPTFVHNLKDLKQYDLIICTANLTTDLAQEISESNRVVGGGVFHTKLMDKDYLNNIRSVVFKQEVNHLPNEDLDILYTGWFHHEHGFHKVQSLSLSSNRIMEGNRGVNIGLSGCVSTLIKEGRLYDTFFAPLSELLTRVKFRGPITLTLTPWDDDLYVRRIIPFINPLTQAWDELTRCRSFELFWSFINDKLPPILMSDEFAVLIRLTLPPFPFAYANDECDCLSVDENILAHLWLQDYCEDSDGNDIIQGTQIGWASARGISLREAQRRVLRTITNAITTPLAQYRADIGSDYYDRIEMLKESKWV